MSSDVAERLQKIREYLGETQKSMAAAIGLSESTWQKCELSGRLPKDTALKRIAKRGVDIHWLLTGDGCMLAHQRAADCQGGGCSVQVQSHSAQIDGDLMGRIVDTIRAVYKAEGQAIPDRSLGELAAEWYGTITSQAAGPGDRLDALAEHQIALRRRLRAATTHPTDDKRPA